MNILVIDCHLDADCWGAREINTFQFLMPHAVFRTRRAPENDLPLTPERIDRIVISGSRSSILADLPWIDGLIHFIQKAVENGIPTLGVCFGHQILVRALKGKDAVARSSRPEYGWTPIQVVEKSLLTDGLPPEFFTFSYHNEEVIQLPDESRVLASSADCAIQAFEMLQKPVFGIQFHPEKNLVDAEKSFASLHKERIKTKLLRENDGKTLYDPKIGETIFSNFFRHESYS